MRHKETEDVHVVSELRQKSIIYKFDQRMCVYVRACVCVRIYIHIQ